MIARDDDTPEQRRLRHRFEMAASKSLAVLNLDDAEPEMAGFLRLVQKHLEQRPFVAQLFMASFDDGFFLTPPTAFLRYCLPTLQWPEIRDFLSVRRDAEVEQRGSRTSPIWAELLEAFPVEVARIRA